MKENNPNVNRIDDFKDENLLDMETEIKPLFCKTLAGIGEKCSVKFSKCFTKEDSRQMHEQHLNQLQTYFENMYDDLDLSDCEENEDLEADFESHDEDMDSHDEEHYEEEHYDGDEEEDLFDEDDDDEDWPDYDGESNDLNVPQEQNMWHKTSSTQSPKLESEELMTSSSMTSEEIVEHNEKDDTKIRENRDESQPEIAEDDFQAIEQVSDKNNNDNNNSNRVNAFKMLSILCVFILRTF